MRNSGEQGQEKMDVPAQERGNLPCLCFFVLFQPCRDGAVLPAS